MSVNHKWLSRISSPSVFNTIPLVFLQNLLHDLSCTGLDSLEFPLEPNFTHRALFFKTNPYSFVNSFFSDNN